MSVEESNDYLTEHCYDGIRESNYPLPRWWLFTLWITVAFGMVYWFYYESTGIGLTSAEELSVAIAEHEEVVRLAQTENGEEGSALTFVALQKDMADGEKLAVGKSVYDSNCAACHGGSGEGMIGPNLTDAQWIHDPTVANLHKIIYDGVLDKGMPAWGSMLGPNKVRLVLGYLTTLFDKNVKGKAAQGTHKR